MEELAITVLSVLACIGLLSMRSFLFKLTRSRHTDKGIKLILCLPPNISPKLEGIVHIVFSEEIPDRLMTDGKLYVSPAADDIETQKILEDLKNRYPLEVLPDEAGCCMIQWKETQ